MLRAWLRVRAASAATRAHGSSLSSQYHQASYHHHQQQQQQGFASAANDTGAAAADANADADHRRNDDDGETVDYGFRDVPRADKQRLVGGVFSSVAGQYDTMNDIMSGGLHRLWKRALVAELAPFPGMRALDVAGGTGDVAFRVLRAVRAAERAAWGTDGRPSDEGRRAGGASGGAGGGAAGGAERGGDSGGGSSAEAGGRERGSVVVCDINPDMLAVGRARAAAEPDLAAESTAGDDEQAGSSGGGGSGGQNTGSPTPPPPTSSPAGLVWCEGDAERLPFPDDSFDAYTVAFGIRNVTDRPAALAEARRVLRPGGRLLVLELCPPEALSRPPAPASFVPGAGAALGAAYDAYSLHAIPRIGAAVAGDADSYRYLVESVRRFPPPAEFAALVREAGFAGSAFRLLSAGVVAIHSGFKV